MLHNERTGQFLPANNLITRTASPTGAGAWGDYDNDGRLDIALTGLEMGVRLYRNLGNGEFERASGITSPAGSHFVPVWVDYDNDGFLDLFTPGVPNPNHLYRNNGDGTFTRVTAGSLITDIPLGGGKTTELWDVASRSATWFDYDNDGFLDLYVANSSDSLNFDTGNFLYHNNGNANGWLKVKLVGTASNRDAVGAKVRLQAPYAGQVRWQRRDITGGDIFNGQQFYAHFGLGDATNVTTLRIEWPSGSVQEFANVTPNQFLTIWEPPALSAAVLQNGACLLNIIAEPNRSWQIESSTDLQTWAQLAKVTNLNARFDYTDTQASGASYRFYRLTGE
jgi:hypothetical protein